MEPFDRFGQICFAPDTGAGGGSPEEKTEPNPKAAEFEALKAQASEDKAKREEAERKLADYEKAKLTEDERKALEDKKLHEATISKFRTLQAKALGIDEKYIDLIKGDTDDEIEKSAGLLAEALKKKEEETEERVKKDVAYTGAPGASADKDQAMDPKAFYEGIIKNTRAR